jgi:hypothetical protein
MYEVEDIYPTEIDKLAEFNQWSASREWTRGNFEGVRQIILEKTHNLIPDLVFEVVTKQPEETPDGQSPEYVGYDVVIIGRVAPFDRERMETEARDLEGGLIKGEMDLDEFRVVARRTHKH